MNDTAALNAQFTTLSDVYELDPVSGTFECVGTKLFGPPTGRPMINKWFVRPRGAVVGPPLSKALVQYTSKARCDVLAEGGLGYMRSTGADVGGSDKLVFIMSAPYGKGDGTTITPDNYDKSAMIFAVRKAIKPTWLNDRDQFTIPETEPSLEFAGDCLVYMLFHGSNQTSSLKDVEYKGQTYQIRNQFFPYLPQDFLEDTKDVPLYRQLERAKSTYTYERLQQHELSALSQQLLDAGKAMYHAYYQHLASLDRKQFKLDYWDVGWYQVRNALQLAGLAKQELLQVKTLHNQLADKIRPQVYNLGFLRE